MIVQAVHGFILRQPSACLSACRGLKQVSLFLADPDEGPAHSLAALPAALESLDLTTARHSFQVRPCW